MNFSEQKKKQLGRKDKSGQGRWDKAISSLCRKINKKDDYYTTSSCAGRIALVKGLPEKARDVFLFKTHDKITFSQLKKELEKAVKRYKDLIYFKQESCILHVASSNPAKGQKMLNKAKTAGWKRSGIISTQKRAMLELMSTEKTELPVADKGKIIVSDSYLRILVREANRKLDKVRQKISRFQALV